MSPTWARAFPTGSPPDFAVKYSTKLPHQYTRTAGHPNLVKQLARQYSGHLNQQIDPMNKVAVTVRAHDQAGGRGRIVRALFYLYVNQIKLGVGTPVFVLLMFVPYNSDEEEDGSSNEEVITGGTWILEPEKGIC